MPIPAEIPVSKYFHGDKLNDIEKYLDSRLESLVRGLRGIREEKVTQWRKVYTGIPREKTKSFPWQNASNVVVQLAGSFVDQLTAKILIGTISIDPLWAVLVVGKFARKENAEEQRAALEDFLAYTGMEPGNINLLLKYVIWIRTFVKYGFGAIKLLPELTVEKVAAATTASGRVSFTNFTRHDGPVAYPIVFEDFLMPSTTIEIERAPIIAQRIRMTRFDIEALKFDPTYDRAVIDAILSSPTRQGPDQTEQEIENDTEVRMDIGPHSAIWDIYQCYFYWDTPSGRYHLIAEYDLHNHKMLKCVFNWLPENSLPFIGARLGSDGERAYGFGFCEMLKDYQEEVSAIHNRRGDASTLANTNLLRVDPGTQLDTQFSIYPNALIPAAKDCVEIIPLGRTANETIKDEQMTLNLATDRAGVGPSSSGAGSGTVNKKGAYSAMGSFQTQQEGNTRANLNVTEFRHSHYVFGRKAALYYAHFGVNKKDIEAMGEMGQHLTKALENMKARKLILPIRAATGSINKEIEKQNLMLFLNNHRAHGQMIMGLLGQLANPMLPPMNQDYICRFILSADALMRRISKDFIPEGDPDQYVTDPKGIQERVDGLDRQEMQQKIMAMLQQMQQQRGGGQPALPAGQPPVTPQPLQQQAPTEDRMPTQ
jgi:hypothetical protein